MRPVYELLTDTVSVFFLARSSHTISFCGTPNPSPIPNHRNHRTHNADFSAAAIRSCGVVSGSLYRTSSLSTQVFFERLSETLDANEGDMR